MSDKKGQLISLDLNLKDLLPSAYKMKNSTHSVFKICSNLTILKTGMYPAVLTTLSLKYTYEGKVFYINMCI